MRTHARSFALALGFASLLLAGCSGSSEANPLLGTWILDAETIRETEEYKSATPQEKQQMDTMAQMMTLEITFTKDEIQSKATMMGETKNETEAYVIEKQSGNSMTIRSTNPDGEKEVADVVVKGDLLEISDGTSEKMVLKRKK